MLGYILRRLVQMLVTLFVISVISFVIIQLPPGDYLTSYIASLAATGETVDQATIEALRKQYGLDLPIYVQYFKWLWGILHGDFGYSFSWNRPVSELLWGRLGLSVLVSTVAVIFSWVSGFLIGMYSATHQYSIGDYLATFLGYIGLATPNFLLALVLLWLVYSTTGVNLGGLFSPQYLDAPWSFAKFVDMLKHLWLPMIVVGTAGMAGLIRTLRANLLDELHKPYVEAALSKGLPENKVFWKYPLRIAMIPFISTVGWSLPGIFSGETITAIVLNLPTVGPLLLGALQSQDMYLAGSLVMFLSFFTVIGTLISDILLAWVDPRIRFE
ncbi:MULTISPECIES: ABC transporter permease [Thermotoga]|uniref:Binding-protein-dependent transport systems inner membrane component n=1 Tax=Thermotoga petrophila (strain ATCC BAA-488 / DSM 13995 / JCM 10881 / RKU-1) TaxID=390874 RepID=A5INB5_THEP1|nr:MULTISPECIES: ABC transporter permease [Thermotoga]ABQ47688.1 binding-protein-dependent transport systems inner membrane component [Thermotoga petrophila RKU-1]ACB08865.1 binding-protein-dependent transport systems inner membrane component [Thermotoga sp. RQ2]